MAIIISAAVGNWSNSATWTGGVVPGNGDSAVINHAVTVDVNTTIGPSAPGYTTSGTLGPFAFIVNGPYNLGGSLNGVSSYFGNGAGTPSLTVATGIALTVRGDVVLNCSQLILHAGATYEFDSSQATTPLSQSYVLEILNEYRSFAAGLFTNGTAGNRCIITSNTAGGNGRITCGEKCHNFSQWDSGLGQLSYTNLSYLGGTTIPAWALRADNADIVSASWCKFNYCGKISFFSSQAASIISFNHVTFTNGINTSEPGQSASGTDLHLDDDGTPATGTRQFNYCYFGLCLQPYLVNGLNFNHCVFAWPWAVGSVAMAANLVPRTFNDCLIYQGEPYAGGNGCGIAHGNSYTNCYFIQDSTHNVNSHFMFIAGGGPGVTTATGNIFEVARLPNGYYGGNCFIIASADNGSTTTNIINIHNNIVLPCKCTMPGGEGYYTPGGGPTGIGAGNAIAAGTLITVLKGTGDLYNYAFNVQYNTSTIPSGIGSIDPDENEAGPAHLMTACMNNIFWNLGTTIGECVWWNSNSHARMPSIDYVYATNLDYNVKWHTDTTSVSYLNSPASWASASTSTPGYRDGWFSGSVPPGVHDIYASNQQFLDNTRCMLTYDTSLGGTGTASHFMSQIVLMNDDSGYNTAYSNVALVAWVRAGFAPTNGTVWRASSNQDTAGAVQMAAPMLAMEIW